MNRIALIILLLAAQARCAHVQFDIANFVTTAWSNKLVTITPSAVQVSGSSIIVRHAYSTNVPASGTFILSNVVAGNYTLTIASTPASTATLTIPTDAGLVSASACVTAGVVAPGYSAFVRRTEPWAVAPGTNMVATTNTSTVTLEPKINSATANGLVTNAAGKASLVWKTDAGGVPAWRADATADPGTGSFVSNANTLYVTIDGNDSTAKRGRTDLPYLTPTAAAAAMVNGDVMYIGPGDFSITPYTRLGVEEMELTNWCPLLFKSLTNIVVRGSGPSTRLVLTISGHVIGLSDLSGAVFEDFAIVGIPFASAPTISEYHAVITLVRTNVNIVFRNLNLRGSQHGISQLWLAKKSIGVAVENCYFYGFGNTNLLAGGTDGAAISGIGSRWSIRNNTFDYCLRDVEWESTSYAWPVTDCVAEGNLHVNTRHYAYMIWPYAATAASIRNIIIRGNIITNKVTAVGIGENSSSIYAFGGQNILIEGNIFNGLRSGDSSAITVETTSSSVVDWIIQGNSFMNLGGLPVTVKLGTVALTPTNIIVRGNFSRDTGANGQAAFPYDLTGENVTVEDNTIINPNVATPYYGIYLRNVSRSRISGNTIIDYRTPTRTQVGIYLVAGTGNVVEHNYFQNCTSNIHDLATGTVFDNWAQHTTNVLLQASNAVVVVQGVGAALTTNAVGQQTVFTLPAVGAGSGDFVKSANNISTGSNTWTGMGYHTASNYFANDLTIGEGALSAEAGTFTGLVALKDTTTAWDLVGTNSRLFGPTISDPLSSNAVIWPKSTNDLALNVMSNTIVRGTLAVGTNSVVSGMAMDVKGTTYGDTFQLRSSGSWGTLGFYQPTITLRNYDGAAITNRLKIAPDGSLVINQGGIDTGLTNGNLTVPGNISAGWSGQLYGNGAGLSNVSAGTITLQDTTNSAIAVVASNAWNYQASHQNTTNWSGWTTNAASGFWTNAAMGVGANCTNDVLRVGANTTNDVLRVGGNTTNDVLRVGANTTNHVTLSTNQLAIATTNVINTVAGNTTNYAALVGANTTNDVLRVGANTTNDVLRVGQNGTNYTAYVGANTTNDVLRVGANTTNHVGLAQSQTTNNALYLWATVPTNTVLDRINNVSNNNLHAWAQMTTNAYETIWIDAGAMTTNGVYGCPSAALYNPTNAYNLAADVWDFDGTVSETNYFKMRMPDSWDLGTLRVEFKYLNTDITASQSNVWAVAAGAISKNELFAINALGTEVTVSNLVATATNNVNSCTSPAMTVGGTPALGDLVVFRVRRAPENGWDINEADARLLGVAVQWQSKRNNPAQWVTAP